jgi:dienelactone hydrolase
MLSRRLPALIAIALATHLFPARLIAADPLPPPGEALPGTQPLTWTDDIASRMVDGADRFLLSEIEKSVDRRARYWKRDTSVADRYAASIEPNRKRLAHILGVRDARVTFDAPEIVAAVGQQASLADATGYRVFTVRWPAFGDVFGEGLLLEPTGKPTADVVAIPDADQTPEMLAGLVDGVPAESQFARRLAEHGCRVLVPALVDRGATHRKLSNREFLYRSAYELGRHLIGYEVQEVLAGVDWFARSPQDKRPKIGVIGWGEGGLLALAAGALDPRIDAVCVSGYFDSRQNVWQEPLYRNVFGLLEQFGDAELASLIAPRTLVIEAARGPELVVPAGTGGGPGRLVTPRLDDVRREVVRARELTRGLTPPPEIDLIETPGGNGPFGSPAALAAFASALSVGTSQPPQSGPSFTPLREPPDAAARQQRLMHQFDRHNQWLLAESPSVRQQFFAKLDTSTPETFAKTIEPYREYYRDEVIGRFDATPLPPNPRTRKTCDAEHWTGYEVVLDVLPDVFAYGVLLVPKDLAPGQRRPVVVCQHGLEGRPTDVFQGDNPAYHNYAAQLADRGFVVFAPQNPYLFGDRFRSLQRKANPLKKTLFSIIVPQHQQIVDWLGSLPFVDARRIAFYGLSYGGKTAMRVPPLVSGYCLSICSADFNEWVSKNASTRLPYSYVWTGEYEIFEFDLGSTFNYAEMAALIAPRPFMVERGHFDGVGSDEAVGYEFAKVRNLYEARLKLTDRCEIEWFVGPHRYLAWPEPRH